MELAKQASLKSLADAVLERVTAGGTRGGTGPDQGVHLGGTRRGTLAEQVEHAFAKASPDQQCASCRRLEARGVTVLHCGVCDVVIGKAPVED